MNYTIKLVNKKKVTQWSQGFIDKYGKTVSLLDIERTDGSPFEDGLAVFSLIKLKDYPVFLDNALKKISHSYTDTSGVIFGPYEGSEWDETDPPIPDGYVVLGTFVGETLFPIHDFYVLCLQFAEKALEVSVVFDIVANGWVNYEWIRMIQDMIPLLKNKLKDKSE